MIVPLPPLTADIIGPEPGNATLTSNTASAVPPPVLKEYCFTSPKLYLFILDITPIVVPNAFFTVSPTINVPFTPFTNRSLPLSDDSYAVAPLV